MLLAENVDVSKDSRLSTSAKRIGKLKANPLWATNTIFWQINNTRYVRTYDSYTRVVGDMCGIADLLSSGD